MAHRVHVFACGDDLWRHRRNTAQHHRPPAARVGKGVIVDDRYSAADFVLLTETLRKTMLGSSGHELDKALGDLGWLQLLDEMPDEAIPLVFELLGETGAHAPVVNDVVLREAGRPGGETVPLPFAGGSWVIWERLGEGTAEGTAGSASILDEEVPIHRVPRGGPVPLAAGRRRW